MFQSSNYKITAREVFDNIIMLRFVKTKVAKKWCEKVDESLV